MRPKPRPIVVRPASTGFTLDLVRSLHDRPARDESGLFVAEGARFLVQAIEHGATFAGIVICPYRLNGSYLRELVTRVERAGAPLIRLSPSEYAALSPGASNAGENGAAGQGVLMILRQRWEPLPADVGDESVGSVSSRFAPPAISARSSARATPRARRG